MEFTQVVFKKKQKKCFLLKMEKRLPGINAHNSFAKIIKNLFQDNFVFSGRDEDSDCWSEKRNLKENPMSYVLSATGRKYVSTKKKNIDVWIAKVPKYAGAKEGKTLVGSVKYNISKESFEIFCCT